MVFSSSGWKPILDLAVKHCQAEFRKNLDKEGIYQKSGSCLKQVQDVRVIDRLREEQKNAKPSDQFLNTLRFIGELFLSKVLAEKAMHCCIRRLLQKGDGPSLESLCELLQLIQQDLEVVTSKEVMDSYYNQMDFIADNSTILNCFRLNLNESKNNNNERLFCASGHDTQLSSFSWGSVNAKWGALRKWGEAPLVALLSHFGTPTSKYPRIRKFSRLSNLLQIFKTFWAC